jgi:hypothetical protein
MGSHTLVGGASASVEADKDQGESETQWQGEVSISLDWLLECGGAWEPGVK